jgi:molybdopterin molybdotransferase
VALTFDEARACVLREAGVSMGTETVALAEAAGRVLAEAIPADRDYPPFDRSARDGFAVRAADLPGELLVIGEVRAGEVFTGTVAAGEAVEIMTGAPMPDGADAVVMVEHTERDGDRVGIQRPTAAGENFSPRGIEARSGAAVLAPGIRLGHAEIAMLATVGHTRVLVYQRPQVAIVATGDEIVDFDQQPAPHQIRNSNAASLAVQVQRAGGLPEILGIARDNYESTRTQIRQGLKADLLLLSGGVSAGKYDLVEKVLAEFGAEFFFDRVKIQPGQPGNPGSTIITFETIARVAVEKAQGLRDPSLPLLRARLTSAVRHKTGLTRFLPAILSPDGATIAPMVAHGSGDVAALARCNAFLVTDPDRENWAAGEDIRVLVK